MYDTKSGFQNTQEYMASGVPCIKNVVSGTTHVPLHHISRTLCLSVSGSAYIYFTSNASSGSKFLLPNGYVELPLRVKEFWIDTSNSVSILAALTMIESGSMPELNSTTWGGI